LSYQKSKCQDIRSIDIDRARMQAGSGALDTPTGYLAHGLAPHIGADGRHGGTATAWKFGEIGHFCCPNSGQPSLAQTKKDDFFFFSFSRTFQLGFL